ncbi:MAG: NADH-quinone oxidoreductase subunit M, partial [Alphaproteobacteria bacterium]|nr:NADH-quinone oxidoreductase subunit M [Alphaproteobacteria bacterium]
GLPGLAGFVAEVQIFVGAFAVFPVIAAIGLLGILITAALFLRLLQQVFFGDLPTARKGFPDLSRREAAILSVLLFLVVLIGIYPRWLLDLIGSATRAIVGG